MSDLSITISCRTVIDLLPNAYGHHQLVAEVAYNYCTHTDTVAAPSRNAQGVSVRARKELSQ